jgi:hypothetical protein
MRHTTRILALTLTITLATASAQAKPKGATPPKDATEKKDKVANIVGTVLKTDGPKIVLQTHGKQAAEVTVVTDANTHYELNGAVTALDKIKPGMQLVVTPATGTAQKIMITDQPKKSGKKDKKPRPDAKPK